MSSRYDDALVSTLKPTVCPWSTLMSVAKPWIEDDPAPLMPHSLSGLPGRVFSHATALVTGGSQGAADAGVEAIITDIPAATRTSANRTTRRRGPATTGSFPRANPAPEPAASAATVSMLGGNRGASCP